MTQPGQPIAAAPAPAGSTTPIQIPEPNYPMVVHVVADPMFPAEAGKIEEPVHWMVSKEHPFVKGFNVLRMFTRATGVDVFSVSEDGRTGMLDIIPAKTLRLVQHSMPLDVFVEMLEDAENGDDDDDDDDDGPDDPVGDPPAPGPVAVVPNGQQQPS